MIPSSGSWALFARERRTKELAVELLVDHSDLFDLVDAVQLELANQMLREESAGASDHHDLSLVRVIQQSFCLQLILDPQPLGLLCRIRMKHLQTRNGTPATKSPPFVMTCPSQYSRARAANSQRIQPPCKSDGKKSTLLLHSKLQVPVYMQNSGRLHAKTCRAKNMQNSGCLHANGGLCFFHGNSGCLLHAFCM